MEKATFSILTTVAPVLFMIAQVEIDQDKRKQFWGDDASSISAVYLLTNGRMNVTVLPPDRFADSYYSDSYSWNAIRNLPHTMYVVCFVITPYVQALQYFKPPSKLANAAVLFTALVVGGLKLWCLIKYQHLEAESGVRDRESRLYYWGVLAAASLAPPLISTAAYTFYPERNQKKGLLSCYLFFAAWQIVFVMLALIYENLISKAFLDSSSSTLYLMILRGVVHTAVTGVCISWSAFFAKKLQENFNVKPHDASACFALYATTIPFNGRMIQGAAISATQALLFETAAAFAELTTFDGLLRGKTPFQETKESLQVLMSCCSAGDRSATRVEDENMIQQNIEHQITNDEEPKLLFCSDAVILLSVSEGSTLVSVTAVSYVMRRNIGGGPGAGPINAALVWTNLAIMLVGELVVTDGIMGLLARRFKTRYKLDPANEWGRMRERHSGFLATSMVVISSLTFAAIVFAGRLVCTTTIVGDEDSWADTSCPPPPESITEMARVGGEFVQEWLAALNGTAVEG
jgi:hypothetical protein